MPHGAPAGTPLPASPTTAVAPGWRPRQRALALLLWALAMALGGWLIARATYTADLTAFLPGSPDKRQQLLIEQLNSGVVARTLMLGLNGGEVAQRAEASRALAARLRASRLFEQVQNGELAGFSGSGAPQAGGGGDPGAFLVQHRYALSPAVNAERFSADGLRDAIADTLSLLGTPAGAFVKPLLERDPTGEVQRIAEGLIPASAPRTEDGVWMSRSAPRALMLLQSQASGADLDAQAAAIGRIRGDWAALQAAHPDWRSLTLELSGTPVFSVESRASIEAEIKQLAITGTVLMGVLLLLAFGSVPALLVAFVPVASGVVAGIVAVSLGFGTVHGMTLGFGSTLIGESVDYAIYFLIQSRGAAQRGMAPAGAGWRVWLAQAWPTIRLGLLTSVCGFAALVFSGFQGLAQLGVFSLAGLCAAAASTRWVMPALMPDGAAGHGVRRAMGRGAARAVALLPRLRLPLLLVGAAAVLLLVVRHDSIWRADLAALSPVPADALRLDAELRGELLASDSRTLVVVQGADAEATLRAAEAAGQRLDALVAEGRLLGYDSPARFLPSRAAQARRLAALPDAAELADRLRQAQAGSPLPAARLQPFIQDVQAARAAAPVDLAALAGSPLKTAVDAMLVPRSGGRGWLALLPLQLPEGTATAPAPDAAALRPLLAGLPGLEVVDIKQELDGLYARYLREALWQSGLGAAGVVLLLALALRSGRRLLAVCQPLVLAVLLTLGGLVLADVALGILHLVGLLLVVAVGSNYALFFDQVANRPAADGEGPAAGGGAVAAPDPDTLASLLLANLTTVGSFGLIALSQIPALAAIGRVVAPGALLALLLAAAFAPRLGRERGAR